MRRTHYKPSKPAAILGIVVDLGMLGFGITSFRDADGGVPAFLLTWPRRWPAADQDYEAWRASALRGEPVVGRWSTGQNRRRTHPGDVLYWLRQGPDRRGIVGWVERAGEVRVGDAVRLFVPEQRGWAPQAPALLDQVTA